MKNVLLYGADPTGTADSTAAVQAAIDLAKLDGEPVFIPSGAYRISTLDVTGVPDFPGGLTITGEGSGRARLYGSEQVTPGPMVDCTNSNRLRFDGFTLLAMDQAGQPPAVPPSCGFLFAQSSAGGSNRNRLVNCEAFGYFGVACCAILGGSNSELLFFSFQNWSGSGFALYMSGQHPNPYGVASLVLPLAPCDAINEWLLRGELHAWGPGFTSGSVETVRIEGHTQTINHLKLVDCLVDNNTPGGAAIASNGQATWVSMDRCKVYSEKGTPPAHVWDCAGGAPGNFVQPFYARAVQPYLLTGTPWVGVSPI